MAAGNFDAALARVLKHEGGYSNHPSDPGGPTNFGITIHDYRRYIDANGTAADVRAMKVADAAKIYRARYWHALRCDELPAGLDYAVFDYGVNSGIGRAARVMQRLLGIGHGTAMTDAVIAAARRTNAANLIERLCDERLAFLKALRTWPVFGVGWSRRVAEVRRDALAMARGAAGMPSASGAATGKGRVPAPNAARTATAAGAVVAGGGAAQAAAASGASWWLIAAIAGAGLILAVALWAGWSRWHRDRQSAPALESERRSRMKAVFASVRDRLKGWRTLIFGGAVTLAGATLDLLDAFQFVDIAPLLPPEHALKIIAAIGIVTVALRLVTTGRVGSKDC
ncbi:glycoside hydrolase family 108 protein [Pseudorhodoplanes sp.]|uniref:glycoside hydrolase family 108 protein n=1 Tax=Pseudorhodoplanes sp. TaxID=1934341 RepID=UPI00391BB24A